jgi:hypothetical protein
MKTVGGRISLHDVYVSFQSRVIQLAVLFHRRQNLPFFMCTHCSLEICRSKSGVVACKTCHTCSTFLCRPFTCSADGAALHLMLQYASQKCDMQDIRVVIFETRILERGQVWYHGFVARRLGELWKNEKHNTRVGDKNER